MNSSMSKLRKAHASLPTSMNVEHWRNKHAIAINQAPDASHLVGHGGIIFQVDDAACQMFGNNDQDLSGPPVGILVRKRLTATHPKHVAQHEKAAK